MRTLVLLFFIASPVAAETPRVHTLASYRFNAAVPVEKRILPMPEWLLKIWRNMDDAPGYKNYRLTESERSEFDAAVKGLPPRLQDVLKDRLIAVYFLSGLKGNGATDWVLDPSSHVYVYMILNPAALKESLSQTLTARDRSVFRGKAAVSVDAGPGGTGILYSVAHESAHVFDYAVGLTPYADDGVAEALGRPLKVSWDVWSSIDTPRPENDFSARARLRFYGFKQPELDPSETLLAYAGLSHSPFASLYGSKNWADDAADLFVFYHLTRTLKRPYRIKIRGSEGSDTVFEPMSDPTVLDRAAAVLEPVYRTR